MTWHCIPHAPAGFSVASSPAHARPGVVTTRRNRPMRKFGVLASLLVLALCLPLAISAQDTASLTGVVSDPSGAVVAGVSVKLENSSTGASYSATTNSL